MNIYHVVYAFFSRLVSPHLLVNRKIKESLCQAQQVIRDLYSRQAEMYQAMEELKAGMETKQLHLQKSLQELQQMEKTAQKKELETMLLTTKIEHLQMEITDKNARINELIQLNNHLEKKLNQIFSDLSSSIHLN